MLTTDPASEEKQAEILERILELYKGNLLEGSDCEELIFHERERLKSIFTEACRKLSAIHIRCGNFLRAEVILRRAMSAEPYDENICLELIHLYRMQSRNSQAVKVYYRFKKLLKKDLDIPVDMRLTEAIRNIKKHSFHK